MRRWPAPGLDDPLLSYSSISLAHHRAQIANRRVPAFRIVEAFDIVKYIRLGLIARTIQFARGALDLQRRKEALHRGVVPHIARAAHRTYDAVGGHQPQEL